MTKKTKTAPSILWAKREKATIASVEANGVRGISLEDVARRAHVSRTTVYKHFPGGRSQLVEQTATMVFMPNARARAEDYCEGFGLTLHELDLIRTLPAHSRCFLIRQPDASVVVRLDLSMMPELLMVLSGRESIVRRLDAIRTETGDAPSAWFERLTGTAWPEGDMQHYAQEAAE